MGRKDVLVTGYSQLGRIVECAVDDISSYLIPLYWFAKNSKIIVELGVRTGDSMRALLAGAMDGNGRLFSFDIEDCFGTARKATDKFGIKLDWSRSMCDMCDSCESAWQFRDGSVDLIFVDTDHSLETTRREIASWYPKLAPSGIMAFHDTELNEPNRDGVKPAIMEFVAAHPEFIFVPYGGVAVPGSTGMGWATRKVTE